MSSSQRELTCFFARELLPLQVLDRLDATRSKDLLTHLKGCKDCTTFYEQIKSGLRQIEELKKLKPDHKMLKAIAVDTSLMQSAVKLLKWSNWPAGLRWSAELALSAVAIVIILETVPWSKLVRDPRFGRKAAQVQKTGTDVDVPPPVAVATSSPKLIFYGASPGPSPSVQKAAAAVVVAKATAVPSPLPQKVASQQIDTAAPTKGEEAGRGYLYRAEMTVDIPLSDPDPVQIIIEGLGGQRAGQVRLGWKQESGRYYHFTMPENNYDSLVSQLRAIGVLHIHRELHPRVMPKGTMRFILTIEEGNGQHSGAGQSKVSSERGG